ncbi:hypothetical protein LYSHEL_30020 [Lysobacter helvus]|uniref:Transmembrane protein n=2 Tax=Lysobacteraceae TaxID=32033 RepID=A0ABN6FYI1_9GAMM|nr:MULTISPECIES: hypothetical protein [Lysobacter]BCT93975.1 hypothetical protein LYSCAS_29990 [Lysobacter caseinilyticus]BCT97131.1 hypothetical protein LYSHEL_30020 [Lysobacter helvus]
MMTTRTTRPLAGYGWLVDGMRLLDRKPATLFGAIGFFLALSLLPTAITLPLQLQFQQSIPVMMGVMVFSLLAGLALAPMQGGMLQVLDAIANDRPVRARDVFTPYRHADQFWPLVGFAVAILVVFIALVLVVALVLGASGWFAAWQQMVAQQAHPGGHAALPPHFGAFIALFVLFSPMFVALTAIGYAQVAIAGRGVLGALADGFAGGLKNLHVLWILMIGVLVVGIVLALIIGVVAALLGMALKALGTVALVVVLGAFYLAAMVVMYAVWFAFAYRMWRDVCAVDDSGNMPQPLAA